MQNLIGIRVADPAEKMRIGQGSFERVIVSAKRLVEGRKSASSTSRPPGSCRERASSPWTTCKRGLPLRARLGKNQSSVREVEGQQADLAWYRRPWGFPAKPPGNHQVEDEEHFPLQLKDDSLTQAVQRDGRSPANRIERRVDGT